MERGDEFARDYAVRDGDSDFGNDRVDGLDDVREVCILRFEVRVYRVLADFHAFLLEGEDSVVNLHGTSGLGYW